MAQVATYDLALYPMSSHTLTHTLAALTHFLFTKFSQLPALLWHLPFSQAGMFFLVLCMVGSFSPSRSHLKCHISERPSLASWFKIFISLQHISIIKCPIYFPHNITICWFISLLIAAFTRMQAPGGQECYLVYVPLCPECPAAE